MERKGCIYTEYHNKGKRNRSGTATGGAVLRRGVGLVRGQCMRYVGEISFHGKRYRCRSYHLSRVEGWLRDMREKLSD